MLPLAHLGIGLKLAQPFSRGLTRGWILAGALFPDLLDKVLYYGGQWLDLGVGGGHLIAGTRTFGHWGVTTLLPALAAVLFRSKRAAALALGLATHLILDALLHPTPEAVLWPFLGPFPTQPFSGLVEHMGFYWQFIPLALEALGLVLLIDEWGLKRLRRRRSF